MTSERVEEIRARAAKSYVGSWFYAARQDVDFLLAEVDRVTRERDEARARLVRVETLRSQYRKMSPSDQVSVASVEAYLAVILLDSALSGPAGTPEEPAEKLLRDIFTDPAERVRPEDLKAAEAAGSMRAWDETDVELESGVSGGTAQDEPASNHQRYESCVTDSTGRCTRFSHDHSAEDDAQTPKPGEFGSGYVDLPNEDGS